MTPSTSSSPISSASSAPPRPPARSTTAPPPATAPASIDAIITIVYDRAGTPIAFNALTLLDCELRGRPIEVLHLGLVMVDPAHRAGGLSSVLYGLTAFLLFARRRLRPLWVSNVTQVPAVFGMVSESFDDVYPHPQPRTRAQSYDHLHLARQIMARHRRVFGVGDDATYDEQQAIIRNAYTGGSDNLKKAYDDAPKHRNDVYNAACRVRARLRPRRRLPPARPGDARRRAPLLHALVVGRLARRLPPHLRAARARVARRAGDPVVRRRYARWATCAPATCNPRAGARR